MLSTEQRRVVFLSALGGMLELYDFMIYFFFADVFSEIFFSPQSPFLATLRVYAIFAIGSLIRPIGGILFSHFGDRVGRRRIFAMTILFMAVPSFAMSLLPNYQHIGVLAPILLLLLRVMQGFALGGEVPAAMVFVSEHIDDKHRGFATALIICALNLGLLGASGVAKLITDYCNHQQLLEWGWRIPFAMGGILAAVAVYLRKRVSETNAFLHVASRGEARAMPLADVLQQHRMSVLRCTFVAAFMSCLIFYFVYLPNYLHLYQGVSTEQALGFNTFGLAILTLGIFLSGFLINYYGAKRIYKIFAIISIIVLAIAFYLFNLHQHILLAYILIALGAAPVAGALPSVLTEVFPTALRYTGVALSYNLAFGIFYGLAPVVCTSLISWTHLTAAPAFYGIALGIVALFLIKKLPRYAFTL